MKIADILRNLADKLDTIDTSSSQDQAAEPKDFAQPDQDTDDMPAVMISPLQQKLELLKKAVNVPSAFDQDDNSIPDELDAIKKNAGVNPVVVHIASDNDPID